MRQFVDNASRPLPPTRVPTLSLEPSSSCSSHGLCPITSLPFCLHLPSSQRKRCLPEHRGYACTKVPCPTTREGKMPVRQTPTHPTHYDCHLLRETPQQKWPLPQRVFLVNVWGLAWLRQLPQGYIDEHALPIILLPLKSRSSGEGLVYKRTWHK